MYRDEVVPTLEKARAHQGPTLIEFVVEQHDMVYPMVSPGAALNDMVRRPYETMVLPVLEQRQLQVKQYVET
jgi:acetolactate synthase-1/2/3 large subunit